MVLVTDLFKPFVRFHTTNLMLYEKVEASEAGLFLALRYVLSNIP